MGGVGRSQRKRTKQDEGGRGFRQIGGKPPNQIRNGGKALPKTKLREKKGGGERKKKERMKRKITYRGPEGKQLGARDREF